MLRGKSYHLHTTIKAMKPGQTLAYLTAEGAYVLELKEIVNTKKIDPGIIYYDECSLSDKIVNEVMSTKYEVTTEEEQ